MSGQFDHWTPPLGADGTDPARLVTVLTEALQSWTVSTSPDFAGAFLLHRDLWTLDTVMVHLTGDDAGAAKASRELRINAGAELFAVVWRCPRPGDIASLDEAISAVLSLPHPRFPGTHMPIHHPGTARKQ